MGDTITHFNRKADNLLPGYEEATPMVFCGLFPVDADQYNSPACSFWLSGMIECNFVDVYAYNIICCQFCWQVSGTA